jgi:hypothetical protein
MADHVLPSVRILLPCDDANIDLVDESWTLKRPWGTMRLPAGAQFPFRVSDMWVFAQFADGVGTFDLSVELLRLRDDGSGKSIGTSAATRIEFPSGEQLLTRDTAFRLKRVPFREQGLFKFRVTAETENGSAVLPGQVAEVRVLDRRTRI